MAIKIDVEYPNATPADASYPGGSFKNSTDAGSNDGTPLDKKWANDFLGFFQAVLAKAGVVPSGVPDTALDSQYLAALQTILVPVGRVQFCLYTTVDTGWLELDGRTIGNAASNATARANADTLALFVKLWSNPTTQLYTSDGVPVAKGVTAAADFAANKQLKLVDARGRYPRGWDHGAGVDPEPVLVGGTQEDAIQNITGSFGVDDSASLATGAFAVSGTTVPGSSNDTLGKVMTFDASRIVRTSSETRVKDFIGMWVIRY